MSISEFISQYHGELDALISTFSVIYFCFAMDKVVNWYHNHGSRSAQHRIARGELQIFMLEIILVISDRNRDIQFYLDHGERPPDILINRLIRYLRMKTEDDIRHAMKPD